MCIGPPKTLVIFNKTDNKPSQIKKHKSKVEEVNTYNINRIELECNTIEASYQEYTDNNIIPLHKLLNS